MDKSTNGYTKCANAIVEWVWFEGSTALQEGEAVCYNTNYGTATARDGRRCNRVELPASANKMAFAGVAARNYPAHTGGQFVEIYCPGSKGVNVALGVDTVIDTGKLTFTVANAGGLGTEAGRFVKVGFSGRGTIVPRQTVTAVLQSSMTGGWSLAAAGKVLTMTSTGLVAGDTVVLLGGKNDGTGAIVPGKYTIASVAVGSVTLATAAVTATAGGALTCTGYAYTGNPVCQADLEDGVESGGVDFVSPPATGGAAVMGTFMAGGFTYVCGGLTIASAVANGVLAEATYPGARKGFGGLGTLTTNGVTITPAATGYLITGATLTTVTIDAASEIWTGEWAGCWATTGIKGATGA
jgi:hypothetical protein